MIFLPSVQANALKMIFEEQFDEQEIYFEFVEIDEIFNALIGGEMDEHLFEMIERSIQFDEFNFGFLIMISEYIFTIEKECVNLEFFELAHNCKEFNDELKQIIKDNE